MPLGNYSGLRPLVIILVAIILAAVHQASVHVLDTV